MNFFELIAELGIDLCRTLLIEEAARFLRDRTAEYPKRKRFRGRTIRERTHQRVRERLFHKLTTEGLEKL